MSLHFGTSGIRGLNTDFTRDEVQALISGFITYAKTKMDFQEIALAGDLRESTAGIKYLVENALVKNDIHSLDCGTIPTPTLAFFCKNKDLPGIMITGSHIPADRNGLKFYWPWGEILKEDEIEILKNYSQNRQLLNTTSISQHSLTTPAAEAEFLFIQRYVRFFSPFRKVFKNKLVVVYEHSSVARDLLVTILQQLDFTVLAMGRSSIFVPVDTETSHATFLIQEELKKIHFEQEIFAVVSTDGDADRPLVCDETFQIVRGDTLGLIGASFLGAKTVVTPISSNTAIEKSKFFERVLRTQIGSPFVIAGMQLADCLAPVVGFEANGGLLLGNDVLLRSANSKDSVILEKLMTRDSILPILTCLAAAAEKNITLGNLVRALPLRYTHSDLLKNIALPTSQKILKKILHADDFRKHFGEFQETNTLDGVRITLANEDIIHFRPSGNAPEFRCYAESGTNVQAIALVQKGLSFIKGLQ